jgi:hypothetical protein
MACGQVTDVYERYWSICYWKTKIPCGIKWCQWGIRIPCGIQWCRGWLGIPYPCGIKLCSITIPYPCGVILCDVSIPYPCRKSRKVTKYCYDFTLVKTNCYIFVQTLSGCCGGEKYSWTAACFGFVSTQGGTVMKCFDAPLVPSGDCSDLLPPGSLPGGPVDPGSVLAQPSSSALGQGKSKGSNNFNRFGTCLRCMSIALTLFVAVWATYVLLKGGPFSMSGKCWFAFSCLLVFSNLMTLAHLVGYFTRRKRLGRSEGEICGCGGSTAKYA